MGNIKVSMGYVTKYYRLGSLNNRNLFLTVLKVSFRWVGVLWGLSAWVGDGYLFAISSHGLFLVHVAAGPGELSPFSRVQLFVIPWTVAHQAPLSLGFSRQEYWSGLPCPPPGDLPDPGTEPVSLIFPAFGRWVLYHWHHLGNPAVLQREAKSLVSLLIRTLIPTTRASSLDAITLRVKTLTRAF